jgi:putative transposase
MSWFRAVSRLLYIGKDLLSETLWFLPLMARSQASLSAEILFLRKQLAFYQERKIKPRRFDDAARLSLLLLSGLFDWKDALIARMSRYLPDPLCRSPRNDAAVG